MIAMKSQTQQLLASVRKGDFAALAALIDHLSETGEGPKTLARWDWLVRQMRIRCRKADEGKARISVKEKANARMALLLFDLANELRPGWRLPKSLAHWQPNSATMFWHGARYKAAVKTWEWVTTLANGLVAYVRQQMRAT